MSKCMLNKIITVIGFVFGRGFTGADPLCFKRQQTECLKVSVVISVIPMIPIEKMFKDEKIWGAEVNEFHSSPSSK